MDFNSANDQQTVFTDICPRAELSIVKSNPTTNPIVAGVAGTYSFAIRVNNAGPSDSYNVTVTDLGYNGGNVTGIRSIRLGATCNPATLSCFYPVFTASNFDDLELTFTVAASQTCGVFPNTATIASAVTPDTNATDNTSTAQANIIRTPVLVIDKQGQTVATGGLSGFFFVDISNAGPSDGTNVVFTDVVPSPFTVTSVSSTFPNSVSGPVCGNVGQTVTCQFGTLPANSPTYRITINYSVSASAEIPTGNVTNTACIRTNPTAACDANIQACDSLNVTLQCVNDLAITKTDNVNFIVAGVPGQTFFFTIEVTNLAGPSESRAVFAYDTWPSVYSPPRGGSQLTFNITRDGIVDTGAFCDPTGIGFICNLGKIAPGKTVRITIEYEVRATVPAGFYTNEVKVSGACQDTNSTNDVATDTNEIVNRADIGIIKDDCVQNVIAGGNVVTFTFTATNKGPSNSRNVVLRDTLPLPYKMVGIPVVGSSGATCTLIGTDGFECLFPSINVGEIYRITLQYRVEADVLPQSATNCVAFVNPLVVNDTISRDNEDCDTNDICTRADLEITKTVKYGTPNSDCIVAGDLRASEYSIFVLNKGPSVAQNVVVQETLPAGITVTEVPPQCTNIGGNNYTCFLNNMNVGTNFLRTLVFKFTVNAATAAGKITNFVSVQSVANGVIAATIDPELCNNNFTLPALVCRQSDLSVTKSDGVTVVVAGDGERYKYNITVCNNGLSNADSVVIEDLWPLANAGFTRMELLGSPVCTATGTGQNFRCTIPVLVPGQCVSLCAFYKVEPCADACLACNYVTVSSESFDPNVRNNQAQDCNDVKTRADLNVTKTDGVTNVTAGAPDVYTYTIRVCNSGPSCARNVTLLDHFPKDVVQVAGSIRLASGATGSCIPSFPGSANFSCTLLTLQPNECKVVLVDYTVPATAVTCSVHNYVVVDSTTFDFDLCNNQASDTNALIERAKLRIVKTSNVNSIALDDYSAKYFTISVTNEGPSTARDVVVTDVWPRSLCQYPETIRFIPVGGKALTTGGDITANLFDIAPGTTKQIVVPYSVCARSALGSATNVVAAFSPTDTTCRDGNVTVNITPRSKRVEEPIVPVAKRSVEEINVAEPVVKFAPVPVVKHNTAVDDQLQMVTVSVKAKVVGKQITVETLNNLSNEAVRILSVSLTGIDVSGKTVVVNLMQESAQVVSTTCAAFPQHRLLAMWTQSCVVELKEALSNIRVTVGGVSLQNDGAHQVIGSFSA